jgi:cytochrome c oxidase accessory protein FixG
MPATALDTLVQQATGQPVAGPTVETADVDAVNAQAKRQLYSKREKIFPKLVHGRFRRIKWAVMAVTLAIYYLTPWIRWDRGPGQPDQAVLLDLPNRRFYLFFIEIWPQQIYYLTGLLILAAIGLFLVTSVAGRVWCGYTCPQTVWTDLFVLVERLVEGDRAERIRLDKKPWTAGKIARRSLKHGLWIVIAAATGGAWVFYFADAPTLAADLLAFQAPMVSYAFIGLLTFTTYWLGGHMREQVCTYMCPWPRIQGAMLDEESMVVTYRAWRGEPRGPLRKGAIATGNGDCIDCKQCVVACPMGIDIRDGQQLECITCALCIDACDDVMTRIGKPRGLIAYDTLGNLDRRARGEPARVRLLRPRTLLYAAILLLVTGIMAFSFGTRSELEINVINDRNPLYVTLSDGAIRNGYTLKILNMANEPRHFALSIEGLPQATLTLGSKLQAGDIEVPADEVLTLRLFVTAEPDALDGPVTEIAFVLQAAGESHRHASIFRAPER